MLRSEGAGGLVELPTELLTRIFEHLSSVDLCRCACVTRTWTALCLDAKFWRAIHFDYLPVDAPTVLRVCRRYPRLHTVSLRNLVLDARTLSFIFRACPHIVKLSLASARVTSLEHVIQELSLSLHGLLDLDLSNLAITNGMLRRLEERCNRLERLNLSRCTLSPCETIAGGVRMLQLGHSTLRHLALCGVRISATELRCPSLESLDVSGSQLSDAMLFTMTVSSPRLLALSMADCRNVTDPAVKDMLALCRQLRSLDLSGCVCLTADVLREAATAAPQLESLTMARCSLLADLATIPLTSPSLTALDLSHCELLRALDVSSPSLDALTLTGCRSLARVAADCAALSSLAMGGCEGLHELQLSAPLPLLELPDSRSHLASVTLHNAGIRHLSFNSFSALHALVLHCPALVGLDLGRCCSLSDASVTALASTCPLLAELNLEECERLQRLSLSSPSLEGLVLTGCKALVSAELACGRLRSLVLEGCSGLDIASVSCAVRCLDLGTCRQLRELRVRSERCEALSLKGCLRLASARLACASLRSLDLAFCADLTDGALTALGSPTVQELNVSRCVRLSNGLLAALAVPFPAVLALNLSYLHIDDATLCALLRTTPALRTLELAACKDLAFAFQHLDAPRSPRAAGEVGGAARQGATAVAPAWADGAATTLVTAGALEALDISYTTACAAAIAQLLSRCPALRSLKLNGCANVVAAPPEGAAGAADAAGGESSASAAAGGERTAGAQHAHAGTGAPYALACLSVHGSLRHLSMVGCNRLGLLALSGSQTLTDVNVRSCASLRAVRVANCAALRSLSTYDCAELESVSVVGCTALDALDLRNCPAGIDLQLGDRAPSLMARHQQRVLRI